jgi:acetyltransferase
VEYLLMQRLIEIAGQRRIRELVGEVLRENKPMLQMCRELGFGIDLEPHDPAVMLVRRRLDHGTLQPAAAPSPSDSAARG